MMQNIQKLFNNLTRPKYYLIFSNIVLVFILIWFSNAGILPIRNFGDFVFLCVLVLLFALYRPGWAFLFFVGTIALENINLAPDALGIMVRPYQIIGAASLMAVIARYLVRRLSFELPKWNWIDVVVLVFVASGFLSALGVLFSNQNVKDLAVQPVKMSVVIATFAAFYFLTRIFLQEILDLKKIISYFLSSSVIIVFYGIWQNWRFVRDLSNFEVMPGRPNATFAEADWLGIYLVLLIAVIYSMLYFFQSKIRRDEVKIFKSQLSSLFLYILLVISYMLLILTVARSAWLGAGVVGALYVVFSIWQYYKNKEKEFLWIIVKISIAFLMAIILTNIFRLTNFELANRIQSTGSGLQSITISCDNEMLLPETIKSVSELEKYNCRHINLEEIKNEQEKGNFITRVERNDPNISIRSEIYRASWKQIKAHFILGIGWGNISKVLGTDERGAGLNASNIFLEAWLGAGLFGLFSLMIIFGNVLWRSVVFLRSGFIFHDLEIATLGLFLILSVFVITIPNLFNSGIMLGFLWVCMAMSQIKKQK